MIPVGFDYARPESVDGALALLEEHGEDATLLAGGHSLLPVMKLRLAAPELIIDIGKLTELQYIRVDGDEVAIGAGTRHHAIAVSDVLAAECPLLPAVARTVGDPQVRHRGTIGGSIANNDPAADYPAACLALGATIVTNKRKIPADEFFTGLFETALEEGEIITRVSFPLVSRAAYEKFPNPASRYALVGVFVAKRGSDVRVAVTGAGANGVFRVPAMEEALRHRFSPKSLEGVTVPAEGLISDIHADAEYRAHLIGVMARRAVARAASRK